MSEFIVTISESEYHHLIMSGQTVDWVLGVILRVLCSPSAVYGSLYRYFGLLIGKTKWTCSMLDPCFASSSGSVRCAVMSMS